MMVAKLDRYRILVIENKKHPRNEKKFEDFEIINS